MKKLLFTSLAILLPILPARAVDPGGATLNPLGSIPGPEELYGRLLRFMLGFVGVGALAMAVSRDHR